MKSFLSTLNLYNAPAANTPNESEKLYEDELTVWKNVAFEFDETVGESFTHANISNHPTQPGQGIVKDTKQSGSATDATDMEDVHYFRYAKLDKERYRKINEERKIPEYPVKKNESRAGLVQYQSQPLGSIFYKPVHEEMSRQHQNQINRNLSQNLDSLSSMADQDEEVSRGRKRFKYLRQ